MRATLARKIQEQQDASNETWFCCTPSGVWLRETGAMGWGVYARRAFRTDECIGECPVLIIRPQFQGLLEKIEEVRGGNSLANYVYAWGKRSVALPMGWAAFFNHDTQPNVTYRNDYQAHIIEFHALKPIKFMDELTIDYGYDPN